MKFQLWFTNSIENASTRSRAIERKLRNVQGLPVPEANQLLGEMKMASSEST